MNTETTSTDAFADLEAARLAMAAMEALDRFVEAFRPLAAAGSPLASLLMCAASTAYTQDGDTMLAEDGSEKPADTLNDWRATIAERLAALDPRWTDRNLYPDALDALSFDRKLLESSRRANRLALSIERDARELAELRRWLDPATTAAVVALGVDEDAEAEAWCCLGTWPRDELTKLAVRHLAGASPDPELSNIDAEYVEQTECAVLSLDLVLADPLELG